MFIKLLLEITGKQYTTFVSVYYSTWINKKKDLTENFTIVVVVKK